MINLKEQLYEQAWEQVYTQVKDLVKDPIKLEFSFKIFGRESSMVLENIHEHMQQTNKQALINEKP